MLPLLGLLWPGCHGPSDPPADTEPAETDAPDTDADTADTDEPALLPCEPGPADSTAIRHRASVCVAGDGKLGGLFGLDVAAGHGHVVTRMQGLHLDPEGPPNADVAVILRADGAPLASLRGAAPFDAFGAAALLAEDHVWIASPGEDAGIVRRFPLPSDPVAELAPTATLVARPAGGRTAYGFGASLARLETATGAVLVVGSPALDEIDPGPGWVAVFDLDPLTATTDVDAMTVFAGDAARDRTGTAVATGGDLDADGVDDLLVGAPGAADDPGRVWLVTGPFPSGDVPLTGEHGRLDGEAPGDLAGASVAFAGDLDGDGHADVIVGAPWNEAGGTAAGRAYVVHGPAAGVRSLADADAVMTGAEVENLGVRVAGGHDFDGDGGPDVVVAAPGDPRNRREIGEVLVLFGEPRGAIDRADALALTGSSVGDLAGAGLAWLPDVDGDGRDELLIGAPYEERIFVVPGYSP